MNQSDNTMKYEIYFLLVKNYTNEKLTIKFQKKLKIIS
jgi:hypothetical protein